MHRIGPGWPLLVAVLWVATAPPAHAADVKVIAAGAFAPLFKALEPRFERDTGHRLVVTIAATSAIRRAIDGGAAFDVIVTDTPTLDGWGRSGAIAASTLTPVAHAGLGLGVRAGAPKPDIGSVDAARRTLLDAKSVAHGAESASAASVQALLARLGISDAIKPRLRPLGPGLQAKSVASGDSEMLVTVVPNIVSASGVDLAGSFPRELQTYTAFAAAVSSSAGEPAAARSVLSMLTSAAAGVILRARGMEPGAP